MNFRELSPEDIDVFAEAIGTFFATVTREPAVVRTAYLLENSQPILWGDFNGVIRVSGGFRGSVCFSAPRALLSHVLLAMGEQKYSEENFLDVVGEIANTLSGRARRHFGESLEISPPIACISQGTEMPPLADGPPFAIPLVWRGYEANLVVHLDVARNAHGMARRYADAG